MEFILLSCGFKIVGIILHVMVYVVIRPFIQAAGSYVAGKQMPGGALHEVLPGQHRNNPALHQNTYNQGVTPEMRMEDRQLHWWYRAREQGADELLPDSYKDFVSQYGGGYFGFIVVYSCDCNGMFYIEDNVLKEWVAEKCFYQLSI